jgi:16S rRNA (guanine966-N2)-methyltransferase
MSSVPKDLLARIPSRKYAKEGGGTAACKEERGESIERFSISVCTMRLATHRVMRIISGISKGRRLVTPKNRSIRPTSDRVKESIFNILGDEVEGKVVLDLFAGTGNLGIEALSRGAKKAFFVEKGRESLRLIQKNLAQCHLEEQSEILTKEVNRAIGILKQRGESFDLILMDPPYEKGWVQKTLTKLNSHPIYHENSILVIEHGRREPLPHIIRRWNLIRQQGMGDTIISFLTPHSGKEMEGPELKTDNSLMI